MLFLADANKDGELHYSEFIDFIYNYNFSNKSPLMQELLKADFSLPPVMTNNFSSIIHKGVAGQKSDD